MTTLPADSQARKDVPLLSGLFRYFPAALAGVARWSKLGNDKHNPGEPLHHARGKSMDHGDCILRHTMDLEDYMADYSRRSAVLSPAERQRILDEVDARAWRSLAESQEIHERFGAPLAPGAKLALSPKPLTFKDEPYAGMAPPVPAVDPAAAYKVLDVRSPGADTFKPREYPKLHADSCTMDVDHFGNCN